MPVTIPNPFTLLPFFGDKSCVMRKLLLPLLLLLIAAADVRASHFSGGEIRYRPEGAHYRVEVVLYNLCQPGIATMPLVAPVTFTSTCGTAFTRTLPQISIDTVTDAFCASAMPGCGSAMYPATLVATFSDTVTLAPCASWKMWWSNCCRSASITNLSNPGGAEAYLEAFLNNLAAPNACPLLANPPIQPLSPASVNALSLQATDLQGDSIVYEMIPARTNNGALTNSPTALTYAAGYSAFQPFGGTGTSLNSTTGILQATPPGLGQYSVNVRVKDYRQGVLVGYCERDWTAMVSGPANTVPLPAAGTQFQYTTCPGQSHTISLNFLDPGDSVYVTATPDASVTWPITVTGGTGLGATTTTLSWTTPATLNVSATPYFYIRIKARDADCPIRGMAWYDVLVRTAYCNTDSVWAGDADANKIVDLYDPLAIALAHGQTGALRPGASTAWAPQTCPVWATSFLNGVNHKHADCDGNGTVGNADLAAVTLNYGQTHPRAGGEEAPAKTAGLPDLYFDLTGVAAHAGSTVSVPIRLGTAGSTMSNLYGLSARIQIAGVTPSAAPAIAYPPASWLGAASNTLRFAKPVMNNTSVDWSYARTTGAAVSGDGTLAQLDVSIPANTPVGTQMILRFLQPRIIGATGAEIIAYNVVYDTLTVLAPTGIGGISSSVQDAFVVPNPSDRHAVLHVSLAKAQTVRLSITDAVGRAVWTRSMAINGGSAALSLEDVELPAGMYFVRVVPGDGSAGKVVKWVRE